MRSKTEEALSWLTVNIEKKLKSSIEKNGKYDAQLEAAYITILAIRKLIIDLEHFGTHPNLAIADCWEHLIKLEKDEINEE